MVIKIKNMMMIIINYAIKYIKQILKMEFLMFCLLSAFLLPVIRFYVIKSSHTLLFKNLNPSWYLEYLEQALPLIFGVITCSIIVWVLKDIFRYIKKYFIAEKDINKELEYKKSKEVYSFYVHDLETWAKKNHFYNKVPEILWEEFRVAKKDLNMRYMSSKSISYKFLIKRYRRMNNFMKINTKILKLLRYNKSDNILFIHFFKFKNYIKIKNFIFLYSFTASFLFFFSLSFIFTIFYLFFIF